jgi:hypothetical protein
VRVSIGIDVRTFTDADTRGERTDSFSALAYALFTIVLPFAAPTIATA